MIYHIFYSFGILILISSIMNIIKFKKIYYVREWFIKYQKITGKEPKDYDFRLEEDTIIHTNQKILKGIEFLWVIIGLFTPNWYLFLSILILGCVIGTIFGKKFNLVRKLISFKFLLIRTILYLLLILNHFCNLDLLHLIN